MGKRTASAVYDNPSARPVECQMQKNGDVLSNEENSEEEVDQKTMFTGLEESASDSGDSGFQNERRHPTKVDWLGQIKSADSLDLMSVSQLKAILDSCKVQYSSKHCTKSELQRLVTDLWLSDIETSSSGSSVSSNQPVSLKDIVSIDDIDNLNSATLRTLLDEHNIDYKETWSEQELLHRVRRLWAIINDDVGLSYYLQKDQSSPDINPLSPQREKTVDSKSSTYSVHQITDATNLPFSAIDYSRFKFGCKAIAKRFGHKLADGLIDKLRQSPIKQQIVVAASPYCFIPTATFAMKNYFVQRLNEFLVSENLPVIQETKIHRHVCYKGDYGALNAEERTNLIGNECFHIDREFVRGKTILFLDDIRITGSHEAVIRKMYHEYRLDNTHMFVYFVELVNPSIHPSIENELNFAFVKSLSEVNEIIKNGTFLVNTRVVKFILSADHESFKTFILDQKPTLVWKLYHLAMGNSYHLIDEYMLNYEFLKQLTK